MCDSTVRTERTSRSAISAFVRPRRGEIDELGLARAEHDAVGVDAADLGQRAARARARAARGSGRPHVARSPAGPRRRRPRGVRRRLGGVAGHAALRRTRRPGVRSAAAVCGGASADVVDVGGRPDGRRSAAQLRHRRRERARGSAGAQRVVAQLDAEVAACASQRSAASSTSALCARADHRPPAVPRASGCARGRAAGCRGLRCRRAPSR